MKPGSMTVNLDPRTTTLLSELAHVMTKRNPRLTNSDVIRFAVSKVLAEQKASVPLEICTLEIGKW